MTVLVAIRESRVRPGPLTPSVDAEAVTVIVSPLSTGSTADGLYPGRTIRSSMCAKSALTAFNVGRTIVLGRTRTMTESLFLLSTFGHQRAASESGALRLCEQFDQGAPGKGRSLRRQRGLSASHRSDETDRDFDHGFDDPLPAKSGMAGAPDRIEGHDRVAPPLLHQIDDGTDRVDFERNVERYSEARRFVLHQRAYRMHGVRHDQGNVGKLVQFHFLRLRSQRFRAYQI